MTKTKLISLNRQTKLKHRSSTDKDQAFIIQPTNETQSQIVQLTKYKLRSFSWHILHFILTFDVSFPYEYLIIVLNKSTRAEPKLTRRSIQLPKGLLMTLFPHLISSHMPVKIPDKRPLLPVYTIHSSIDKKIERKIMSIFASHVSQKWRHLVRFRLWNL